MPSFISVSTFLHSHIGKQFITDTASNPKLYTIICSSVGLHLLQRITYEGFQASVVWFFLIFTYFNRHMAAPHQINPFMLTVQPFHFHHPHPPAPKQKGCPVSNLDCYKSCSLAAFTWSSPALQVKGDLLLPIDIQLRYGVQYFTVQSNMLGFPKSCSSEKCLLMRLLKSWARIVMLGI